MPIRAHVSTAATFLVLFALGAGRPLAAQTHEHPQPPSGHQHGQQTDHAQHDAAGLLFQPRDASGTAWIPELSPMYGLHGASGDWQVMWHGSAFLQYLRETGNRGSDQFGSINWIMAMARREAAGGRFGLRGMLSLEPLTIPGCGYPDLLATGEVCDGAPIHDRQHPHDLFMELAAEFDAPLSDALRWNVYGGLAGEPALGPAAYPHRISALPNPLAPTSHHWLDATHITFGVLTGSVYGSRWKGEASLFNGREPDEERGNIDLAALDSFAGRVWFAPAPSVVLQVSAARLNEAEQPHEGSARVDVARVTASATYHRPLGAGTYWDTTVAWGRNAEEGDAAHALLVESNVTVSDRDAWYGRFEVSGKAAHDLDVHGTDEIFTVAKLQAGYTRYLTPRYGLSPGVGGSASLGFVPDRLEAVYGRRVNPGFAIYVTLRPASHQMQPAAGTGGRQHEQQSNGGPARLEHAPDRIGRRALPARSHPRDP